MNITRRTLGASAVAVAASSALPRPSLARAAAAADAGIDVIVLGAGASGLQAAWLLEQQGARVLVLEGRRRVGGRVYTLMDQPGTPEMGFNAMGAGYGRALDAAKRAGVTLYDAGPRMAKGGKQELVLGGKIVPAKDWPNAAANPFPAALRAVMPWQMSPMMVAQHNPLQNWAEWLKPQNRPLDISMHDFLRQQGLSDAAIRLAFDTSPYYGANAGDVSALMFEFNAGWGKTQAAAGHESWAVKGGNQKLADGMAKILKGDLLLGKTVAAIASHSGGVTVRCRDGSSYKAKKAVCSLPFATLRQVAFEPAFSAGQARAVRTLHYQPISIAFLTVKSPFWQKDGLSPSMWTDGVAGTVLAQYFGPTENDVSGLMVQARGALATRWDGMGQEAALAMIEAELETIRPAAKGQVHGAAMQSWALDPFNKGDWAYFAPGQISDFVAGMSAPAGNVHFCGEHTAIANRGMEGALESSERVAVEILSA